MKRRIAMVGLLCLYDDEGYYVFFKGYIEKEGELRCFYSAFNAIDGNTYFLEGENISELLEEITDVAVE